MEIVARKLSYIDDGINKQTYTNALQHISDQLRWIDQKLTMKVDHDISQTFYGQQLKIDATQTIVNQTINHGMKP